VDKTKKKLLLIGHDNLFSFSDQFNTDYLGSASRGMGKSDWIDTVTPKQVLQRLLCRQYDYIILPEVLLLRIGWQSPSSKKHRIAKFLYRLSYSKLLTSVVRFVMSLFLRNKTVFFIGRFEQSGMHKHLLQFFPNAKIYRTTSRMSDQMSGHVEMKPLKWWMNVSQYPDHELVQSKDKQHDVFFAGGTTIRERRKVNVFEEELARRNVKFYWPRERLDFNEFTKTVAYSKIAWSPEGTSWQCWRHYEALFYGAIPLINKPHESVYNTLKHGETALFYSSLEEAFCLIEQVVAGELDLALSIEERRQFVIDNHSEFSTMEYLTSELLREG